MIRIAIIGTGGIAHSHARVLQSIQGVRVTACCDIVVGKAAEFASKHGISASYGVLDEMLDREALDAVSVATSDDAHAVCSLAAIKRGLHVFCEKPLSDNLADAKKMAAAARRKGVITGVNFSYRNAPATQKAAQLVQSGKLGRIMHVSGKYLQSWLVSKAWGDWRTGAQWLWRLSKKHKSLGCLGDVGVHLFDLALFTAGDISEVFCDLKTFDKEMRRVGEYELDANDSFTAVVRFKEGALGTLSSSRWATGKANQVAIRIHGDEGAVDLDLDRPRETQLMGCLGKKAVERFEWKPVKCPKVPNMLQRFVKAVKSGEPCQTNFESACKVQKCLDAGFRSAETGGLVKLR